MVIINYKRIARVDIMDILFLGTGGGRWTTITQKLKTGGIRIEDKKNFHIDPGPGAIVNLNEAKVSPLDTDAVFVTHSHPDHYNDAELLIEAMTKGMTKRRGFFAGSTSVLHGSDKLGPNISNYHKSQIKDMETMVPGKKIEMDGISVDVLPTKHSDSTAVGLKFHLEDGVLTYTSDTEYFEGMEDLYSGSRILIMNVIRPKNRRIPGHMCVDDVIKIVEKVKPELAIMQHFGAIMADVIDEEARRANNASGVTVIAAKDMMRIHINKDSISID